MNRIFFALSFIFLCCPAPAFAQEADSPAAVACPAIAMLCPDGSAVSPQGPHCEMAPCPNGHMPSIGNGRAGAGTAGPPATVNLDDMGLAKYPDNRLERPPFGPQTVKFVVDHRTALNDKHITVHGTIVSTLLGEQACPPHTDPAMGRPCALPRITIADTPDAQRDMNYDVQILLRPDNRTAYATGQNVDITGTVVSGKSSVVVRKD